MFQCTAVRRASSHEEFEEEKQYNPGEDILDELAQDAGFTSKDVNESNLPAYTKEITCEENEINNLTNKIATGIYNYKDKSDYTYGRLSRLLIFPRCFKQFHFCLSSIS